MKSPMALGRHGRTIGQIALLLTTLYIVWAAGCTLTRSTHPVMVVSSQSMEPTFYRGDLLLLSNRQKFMQVGEIPVCWFPGNPLPMVHRAVKVVNATRGNDVEQHILTKGDNNVLTDESLYPRGQNFVYQHQIVGVVKGHIPYLGWLAIVLNEHKWVLPLIAVLASVCSLICPGNP